MYLGFTRESKTLICPGGNPGYMDFMDSVTSKDRNSDLASAYGDFSEGAYKASFSSFSDIDSPEAEYCLAFHYLNGRGTHRDVEKAFALFVSSMEHGYLPAIAEVAQCYGYGIGTGTDDVKAFELFSKAAEAGDPYGMGMLSLMYLNGDGVKKDSKKAEEWSECCEDAGDIESIETEGLDLLMEGNVILARLYLMRSAVMGSPVSAKALACIYGHGEGVCRDGDEAADWEDTADCNGWDEVTRADLLDYEDWFSKYIELEELDEE